MNIRKEKTLLYTGIASFGVLKQSVRSRTWLVPEWLILMNVPLAGRRVSPAASERLGFSSVQIFFSSPQLPQQLRPIVEVRGRPAAGVYCLDLGLTILQASCPSLKRPAPEREGGGGGKGIFSVSPRVLPSAGNHAVLGCFSLWDSLVSLRNDCRPFDELHQNVCRMNRPAHGAASRENMNPFMVFTVETSRSSCLM